MMLNAVSASGHFSSANFTGKPSCSEHGSEKDFDDLAIEKECVIDNSNVSRTCLFSKGKDGRRKSLSAMIFVLQVFLLLFICVSIGARVQLARTVHAPSTARFYDTTNVCGIEMPPPLLSAIETNSSLEINQIAEKLEPIVFKTFESTENATADNFTTIAHCGECGACSNPHDIQIYGETNDSLFKSTLTCAKHSILGGKKSLRKCMKEHVGFTDGCNECWVENIMCDRRLCLFTCIWQEMMFGPVNSDKSGGQQSLNRCTECDEKRCGPAFVKCAGVNRRRAGIRSEFERKDSEVCRSVDVGWWNNGDLQEYWNSQVDDQMQRNHVDPSRHLSLRTEKSHSS